MLNELQSTVIWAIKFILVYLTYALQAENCLHELAMVTSPSTKVSGAVPIAFCKLKLISCFGMLLGFRQFSA